jgi:peptide/nickel transport system permease protein
MLDAALMRIVDIGLAFPFLLLVMALAAALDRTTPTTILLTLGLTGWLGTARIVRAKTMQLRNLDFVTASRALGQSTPGIMLRHVLPNVAGPLVVVATVSVAQMILAESVLSFLGGGIAPPTPTWGHMLFEGQDYFTAAPWISLAPGLAIMASVLGFNMLGEGLRDALDPRKQ